MCSTLFINYKKNTEIISKSRMLQLSCIGEMINVKYEISYNVKGENQRHVVYSVYN